jgi:molybdopterin synthase catalytic subunit
VDPRAPERVRLCRLQEAPVLAEEVRVAVAEPGAGGVVVFTGAVREHADGRPVRGLAYEAHPLAAEQLADVAAAVAARPGVVAVAAVHRLGTLAVGELAVAVAASAEHREEAFVAARELIDRLKAEVAIWKCEHFADGQSSWVGTPC